MGKRSDKRKKRKKKLRQNNIPAKNRENKTKSVDKQQSLQTKNRRWLLIVSNFLQKWAFPSMCVVYGLLLMQSFVSINEKDRFIMSLFMSLLSLFISIIFSGFGERCIESIMSKIPIKNLLRIQGLCQFFFAVLLAFLVWRFLISNTIIYEYITEKGTIGDILTWLSIIVFFVDKNIKK